MSNEKDLFAHLSDIMAEVGYVQKQGVNTSQGYRFASADQVMTKVRAACHARGICVSESGAEILHFALLPKGENTGKSVCHAAVRITQTYRLGEQSATFQGLGGGADHGDKAVMKANTAATKYLLTNAFNVSWGDDPEADASTDEKAKDDKPKKAKKTGRKKAPPATPPKDILDAVTNAADLHALEAAKAEMLKNVKRGTPEWDLLKKAVQERRATLAA